MKIGIDLGGTKIAGALVSKGKILKHVKVPTGRKKGREYILAQLKSVVDSLKKSAVTSVGIGAPDFQKGTKMVHMTNIPELEGVDLAKTIPNVKVMNDADCFVLGEWKYGSAKGKKRVVGLTLGTGLGSGVILDGKLLTGRTRKTPELGHLIINTKLLKYKKGSADWEAVLSGQSIVRRHKKYSGKTMLAQEIWKSNTRAAKKTRFEIERFLAIFCANIIRMYDPDVIVIGGGAANSGLVKGANSLMKNYRCKPILKLSKLKEKAAMIGAASL